MKSILLMVFAIALSLTAHAQTASNAVPSPMEAREVLVTKEFRVLPNFFEPFVPAKSSELLAFFKARGITFSEKTSAEYSHAGKLREGYLILLVRNNAQQQDRIDAMIDGWHKTHAER
jgi:hypothetical protein